MATYTASYAYTIDVINGATLLNIRNTVNANVSDGDLSSETFTVGEPINFVYGAANFTVPYLGTFEGGIVVEVGGSRLLYTNTDYPFHKLMTINAVDFVTCFLAGTRIATPAGERAVEELAIGDLVLTAAGATRPVRWIGRQTVSTMFADPLRSHPVRIAAGALGADLPARDLFLSPDHALLIDGLMVQAGALVNGTTIARHRPEAPHFTYFHIELDDHALILAEGVPAETFVDNVTRRRFDNYAEFAALYGDGKTALPELDLPRVKSARQLPPALRARLAMLRAA